MVKTPHEGVLHTGIIFGILTTGLLGFTYKKSVLYIYVETQAPRRTLLHTDMYIHMYLCSCSVLAMAHVWTQEL